MSKNKITKSNTVARHLGEIKMKDRSGNVAVVATFTVSVSGQTRKANAACAKALDSTFEGFMRYWSHCADQLRKEQAESKQQGGSREQSE